MDRQGTAITRNHTVEQDIVRRTPSAIAPAIEAALMLGDLKGLDSGQRIQFYNAVCESVGLNPLTRPLEYIVLNGKLTLYARKDAADQLRFIHKVSVEILSRELVENIYVVRAKAFTADGRQDESIGAVDIAGLKGTEKANGIMKAETKAKRRVTLSICGLGFLDENEVDAQRKPAFSYEPLTIEAEPQAQLPESTPAAETKSGLASLTSDEIRDIEVACHDAKLTTADLRAWVKTQTLETVNKAAIFAWIAEKR